MLAVPLTRADISGVYAGLRPLLSGEHEETSQLSREHAISRSPRGMVSVAGGKYTTYRVMARDAVDAAVATWGGMRRPASPSTSRCWAPTATTHSRTRPSRSPLDLGLPRWRVDHLLNRYGAMIDEVLAPAADDPSLLEPVPGAGDHLMAEVRYAATHEAALHLDDVLARRTRISIETSHRGVESAPPGRRLLATVLGWDAETVDARWRPTSPGSKRSGSHRSRPTTRTRTPAGCSHPTRAERWSTPDRVGSRGSP